MRKQNTEYYQSTDCSEIHNIPVFIKHLLGLSSIGIASILLILGTPLFVKAHHHKHWQNWERHQRRIYNRNIRRAYHWQSNHHNWRPFDYGYRRNFGYSPVIYPPVDYGPNRIQINF